MMNWTDRHCRYFHRLLNRNAWLYTEMIHANAVTAGDRQRLLRFDAAEHPVAVQLGGNQPSLLAEAAIICAAHGYDEINLNIGCPSDRVQTGEFGACLMARPALVASCVRAIKNAVKVPVTVKTRIGIDEHDSYEFLHDFVEQVVAAGADGLIVHARIAILSGLSPKQNREVPPLNYRRVERIAGCFTDVPIILNGGIDSLEKMHSALQRYSGVMIGRAAYHNPWLLAQITDSGVANRGCAGRAEVVQRFLPYVEQQCAEGVPLQSITRHVLGLFQGQPGARAWRRHLSENSHRPGADYTVLEDALALVDRHRQIPYK